jgi:hypothetical protein
MPSEGFSEILPRFISKLTSHKANKRIFSDRDSLFYWLYALGSFGVGFSLFFITQGREFEPPPATNHSLPIQEFTKRRLIAALAIVLPFAEILPRFC